ncbi:hypothetical protein M1523_02865 [Patescibacteria group bacterium]|nr:hypothetical protein [Patescibacteria group bacterium]MCL5091337.1 hypothetical protein [Patescibacteria group bacterium]
MLEPVDSDNLQRRLEKRKLGISHIPLVPGNFDNLLHFAHYQTPNIPDLLHKLSFYHVAWFVPTQADHPFVQLSGNIEADDQNTLILYDDFPQLPNGSVKPNLLAVCCLNISVLDKSD